MTPSSFQRGWTYRCCSNALAVTFVWIGRVMNMMTAVDGPFTSTRWSLRALTVRPDHVPGVVWTRFLRRDDERDERRIDGGAMRGSKNVTYAVGRVGSPATRFRQQHRTRWVLRYVVGSSESRRPQPEASACRMLARRATLRR